MSIGIKRLAGLGFVGSTALLACQSTVAGAYELDLEQTKRIVEQAAAANPQDAARKDDAIAMLSATTLDVRLEKSGELTSSTTLLVDGKPRTTSKKQGRWKLTQKQLTLSVDDTPDTECEVDGQRLRCVVAASNNLFTRYVLVRK